MARIDRGEVVESLSDLAARMLAELPIEREIEELVQNQPFGQTFAVQRTRGAGRIIGVRRHSRPYSFAGLRGRRGLLTSQPWRDDRVLRAARDLVGPCSRRWGAPKLGSVPFYSSLRTSRTTARRARTPSTRRGPGRPIQA